MDALVYQAEPALPKQLSLSPFSACAQLFSHDILAETYCPFCWLSFLLT